MGNATAAPKTGRAPSAQMKAAIAQAVPELTKRMLDPSRYEPVVHDEGATLVVVFADRKGGDALSLGSGGDVPTLEVEIDKSTLRVKRAYFAR